MSYKPTIKVLPDSEPLAGLGRPALFDLGDEAGKFALSLALVPALNGLGPVRWFAGFRIGSGRDLQPPATG
jgi:hypothetical protein